MTKNVRLNPENRILKITYKIQENNETSTFLVLFNMVVW